MKTTHPSFLRAPFRAHGPIDHLRTTALVRPRVQARALAHPGLRGTGPWSELAKLCLRWHVGESLWLNLLAGLCFWALLLLAWVLL